MENDYSSPWAGAARDALFLALVTIIVTLVASLIGEAPSLVGIILWIIKFGGSIYLLRTFINRCRAVNPEYGGFSYGWKVCLFSSLICAVFTFVLYQYITPGTVEDAMEEVISQMGSQLPRESADMLLGMADNFPRYAAIGVFFWDFLIGLAASAILGSASGSSSTGAGNTSSDGDEL